MLDQSFSAHNFEIIYCLERRKGNIEVLSMPDDYQSILSKITELKNSISSLSQNKKNFTEAESLEYETKKFELETLKEQREKILHHYFKSLELQIRRKDFRFTFDKFDTDNGKEVFTINNNSHAYTFAMKQLQYNLHRTFKVKQSSRHSILTNIKTFMNSHIPVYVIRTDISSFYESLWHDRLLSLFTGNTLLSYKSKALIMGILQEYDNTKDTGRFPKGQGVPRGIGISAYLSELYMRDIDAAISSRAEVMFYARYVDDIFMILNSLPTDKTLTQYYDELISSFQKYGLTLKQQNDGSDKCRLIDFTIDNNAEASMDYLGYSLHMNRTHNKLVTKFGLSQAKKTRYHEKIDNIIKHFETLSKCNIKQAYHDLFDALNMISGNYKLYKTKNGVKVGLYYNNDLIDNTGELDELTNYLQNHAIEPYNGLRDSADVRTKISKRFLTIDFKQRWKDRKMYKFSMQRMQEIDAWL